MAQILETLAGTAYYLTANLENGETAKDLAVPHSMRVEVLFPKELPLSPDAVALIVDLDNLGLDAWGRCRWLAELAANPPRVLTFVHSYDFDEDGADAKNVMLARRMDDSLLRRLMACLGADEGDSDPDEPEPGDFDDELARIRLGSDGGPLCD